MADKLRKHVLRNLPYLFVLWFCFVSWYLCQNKLLSSSTI